jgi:hypothetical protein
VIIAQKAGLVAQTPDEHTKRHNVQTTQDRKGHGNPRTKGPVLSVFRCPIDRFGIVSFERSCGEVRLHGTNRQQQGLATWLSLGVLKFPQEAV